MCTSLCFHVAWLYFYLCFCCVFVWCLFGAFVYVCVCVRWLSMKCLVRSWKWKCLTKTQTRMTSWGGSFFHYPHCHSCVFCHNIITSDVSTLGNLFIYFFKLFLSKSHSIPMCFSAELIWPVSFCPTHYRVKVDLDIVKKARVVDDVSSTCFLVFFSMQLKCKTSICVTVGASFLVFL